MVTIQRFLFYADFRWVSDCAGFCSCRLVGKCEKEFFFFKNKKQNATFDYGILTTCATFLPPLRFAG